MAGPSDKDYDERYAPPEPQAPGEDAAAAPKVETGPDDSAYDSVYEDKLPANGQKAEQTPTPAPDRSFGERVYDAMPDTDTWLSFAKGAAQGLGKYGEPIGHAFADLTARQTGEGVYPGMGGKPGETVKTGKSLLEMAPANPIAEGLGTAATGIPAMIAAGPEILPQVAMGAVLGGSRGAEDGGPEGALTGLLTGGLSGLGGGLLGKYGVPALARASIPEWASLTGLVTKPWATAPVLAAKMAARANPYAAELTARGAGGFAASAGGGVVNAIAGKLKDAQEAPKAKAQDVAYAGTPTTSWAVQSVLSSGTHGLSPEDEQRLTEAVMSGDDQKVISTNFLLSQRNPAYAKRLQDEYESLQHGGE